MSDILNKTVKIWEPGNTFAVLNYTVAADIKLKVFMYVVIENASGDWLFLFLFYFD